MGRRVQGLFFEDLSLGQSAEITRTVHQAEVDAFAEVSGDANPVHLDELYARGTPFGGRIAHGMLTASYISAVLGMKLPGPGAIYLSQTLKFRRPVKVGDAVTARVTVAGLDARRAHVTFTTLALVDGKAAVEGEALIMVPRRTP